MRHLTSLFEEGCKNKRAAFPIITINMFINGLQDVNWLQFFWMGCFKLYMTHFFCLYWCCTIPWLTPPCAAGDTETIGPQMWKWQFHDWQSVSTFFSGRHLLQLEGPRGRETRLCCEEEQRESDCWDQAVGGLPAEGKTEDDQIMYPQDNILINKWRKRQATEVERKVFNWSDQELLNYLQTVDFRFLFITHWGNSLVTVAVRQTYNKYKILKKI